mmetsp:Transcript_33156/g.75006  ORF Transcript_33156/g.75006 Transcript_33156/m.75006 type:complete len:225 (-) Transcript_33156:258-932(-)
MLGAMSHIERTQSLTIAPVQLRHRLLRDIRPLLRHVLRPHRCAHEAKDRSPLGQEGHPVATAKQRQGKAQYRLEAKLPRPAPAALFELHRGIKLVLAEADHRDQGRASLHRQAREALPPLQDEAHGARGGLQALLSPARSQGDAVSITQQAEAGLAIHTDVAMGQNQLPEEGDPKEGAVAHEVHRDAWEERREAAGIGAEVCHRGDADDTMRMADKNVGPLLSR